MLGRGASPRQLCLRAGQLLLVVIVIGHLRAITTMPAASVVGAIRCKRLRGADPSPVVLSPAVLPGGDTSRRAGRCPAFKHVVGGDSRLLRLVAIARRGLGLRYAKAGVVLPGSALLSDQVLPPALRRELLG